LGYFIHQSWGRIRIKIPALKNNHFKLSLVKQILSRLDGVKRVSSNLITGSIVINYDPCLVLPAKIINLFNSLGLLPNVVGFPGPFTKKSAQPYHTPAYQGSPVTAEWLSELSKFIIKNMIDKALTQTGKVLFKKIT